MQIPYEKEGEKVKKVISIIVLLSLVVALCGCNRGTVVLINNDAVEVTRTGRQIRVTDVETGAEGNFIIKRVKRGTGETAQENHVGNLTVLCGRDVMVVSGGGKSWIIQFRR